MEMDPLKAPGPHKIHAMLYQKAWNMVERSLVKLVNDFELTGKLPK